MATQKTPKNAKIYICEDCDFTCSKKSEYNRHLMTAKHKKATNGNMWQQEWQQSTNYVCGCGRAYSHRASLYKHKKKCEKNAENAENAENVKSLNNLSPPPENIVVQEGMNDSIIIKCFQTMMDSQTHAVQAAQAQAQAQSEQIRAQAEQTRLLVEAISLNGMQSITNNTTNNNQFNLNVFLNEDCKNAYTLKEVAESIECSVSDLDRMDKDGYAATVTRKILESIENMSITERPIHCTDARRNAVCVKSETGWERNEEALKTLNSTIFLIGNKIHGMMDAWRAKYPEHFKGSESRRKQYHRLVLEVIKVSDPVTESHIVKKVCSGVVLDRKAAMAR